MHSIFDQFMITGQVVIITGGAGLMGRRHMEAVLEGGGIPVLLDIFEEPFAPLIMAEVEFPDIDMANAFIAPDWFKEDVTNNPEYHNSNMSRRVFE